MTPPASPFTISAPGSLMLMGEHAVLHGTPALCMAVEPRLTLQLTPRTDRDIHIHSGLGSLRASLDALPEVHELGFVLACIRHLRPERGFDATIRTQLDATRGLGSSAAVTVVMTAALRHLSGLPLDPGPLAAQAREIIRSVQGRASGCDAAASCFGGLVRVEADPFRIEALQATAPFAMAYVGYKTPTAEVIARVEASRQQHPGLYAEIFDAMACCVEAAVSAIRSGDWEQVGGLMTRHHYLQGALGTSDPGLDQLMQTFCAMPGILGAKISGSGLGDSVLALGRSPALPQDERFATVTLSPSGVRFDD